MKVMAPPTTGSGPSDRLTLRILAVCDAVGAYIEGWGFRSIHGRVWALLAMHDGPMAQTEIAEVLGVSRSLVSLAISELADYGLVKATGDARTAPWVATWDVWATVTDVIRSREWMLMERARQALEAAASEAAYARERGESIPWNEGRIRLLLTMTEFAQATLRAVLAIRMPRSLDALGKWLEKSARAVDRLKSILP
jgi:DNA-binding transcriptional regulator GbsR (MarR family)